MSDASFDEAAEREWQLREHEEMLQGIRRRRIDAIASSRHHFWLHAGVFSVVVHALIVRHFTPALDVNIAVVALGALVSLVEAVATRAESR